MRLKPIVRGVAGAFAVLVAAGWLLADAPKPEAKPTKKKVQELMTAAHKGAKSPLGRTNAELTKDAPNWEQLLKDARTFVVVGDALKTRGETYTSPEGYIAASAALAKAAAAKDKAAAAAAFGKLTQSCGACHYGGVGISGAGIGRNRK